MKNARTATLAATLFLLATNLYAATYYVDSKTGSDANSGTSFSTPWQSLHKVNTSSFHPGDKILFRSGSVWEGQLIPPGSGTAGRPIRIDKYGAGPLPRINGNGVVGGVVSLHNVEQIEVRHLELTNDADAPGLRFGVLVQLQDFGTAHHIILAGLKIHNVRGNDNRKESGGICFGALGRSTPSRFDGIVIERNIIYHLDRSGIVGIGHAGRKNWFPSLHVLIRDNYLQDIGGDGIVPWVSARPIIEHNIVLHAAQRSKDFNAGIWSWSTDDAIFQLNEAGFTGGTKDGEGFDADHYNRNSLFQYNYSHDNQGGFILLCTPVHRGNPENDIGNTGTLVRYNLSWNDHTRTFNLAGASDLKVNNNYIYVGPEDTVQVLLVSNWFGWSSNALFTQNHVYAEGNAIYGHDVHRNADGTYDIKPGWGIAKNIRWIGNSYFGSKAAAPPEDTESHIDHSQQAAPWKDDEPKFDPAAPNSPKLFLTYIKQHRKWMKNMLSERLHTKIRLIKIEPEK